MEKEMATHSSILAGEVLRTEEPGGLLSTGVQESDTTEELKHQQDKHWQIYQKSKSSLGSSRIF